MEMETVSFVSGLVIGLVVAFFAYLRGHSRSVYESVDDYNTLLKRYYILKRQLRDAGIKPADEDENDKWRVVLMPKRVI